MLLPHKDIYSLVAWALWLPAGSELHQFQSNCSDCPFLNSLIQSLHHISHSHFTNWSLLIFIVNYTKFLLTWAMWWPHAAVFAYAVLKTPPTKQKHGLFFFLGKSQWTGSSIFFPNTQPTEQKLKLHTNFCIKLSLLASSRLSGRSKMTQFTFSLPFCWIPFDISFPLKGSQTVTQQIKQISVSAHDTTKVFVV